MVTSVYKPVPVEAAREISKGFDKSIVVIIAFDGVHQLLHVTTYGATAQDKQWAAQAGEICNEALGALAKRTTYEDFGRSFDAALYAEACELLTAIANEKRSLLTERVGHFLKRRKAAQG